MVETPHPEASAEGSTQADNKQPVYEVGFHIVPTVAEAEVGGVVEKIRALLGDLPDGRAGAEIIKEEYPHKLTLAYAIERSNSGKREKYNEAYFGWIKFATDKSAIPALQRSLTAMREVLRFLVVETVREDMAKPRRAIFTSDRLEGETIQKPVAAPEKSGEVSDEELDKSLEALVTP
ncbi:MAG: 30S ribosomal protein S6 [Patescibacteria group bacterium]|nr:30S ribosomal protein S6 [Patescibacteria group bacterium]